MTLLNASNDMNPIKNRGVNEGVSLSGINVVGVTIGRTPHDSILVYKEAALVGDDWYVNSRCLVLMITVTSLLPHTHYSSTKHVQICDHLISIW